MTKSDDEILMLLDSADIIVNPKVIAYNTSISRQTVQRRLPILIENELVEKPSRGMYEITDRGRDYLAGELDAEDLEE
jgi:predicted transcriptional regulator